MHVVSGAALDVGDHSHALTVDASRLRRLSRAAFSQALVPIQPDNSKTWSTSRPGGGGSTGIELLLGSFDVDVAFPAANASEAD